VVRAPTWPELLAEAGRALGELERRGAPAGAPGPEREIEARADDPEALLVDFLNEMIFLAERHRWIPLELDVLEADERHVRARGRGMVLPEPPALVKAATMHGLSLARTSGACEAEVVLDV
jgi:SHS2 domain-containing protein